MIKIQSTVRPKKWMGYLNLEEFEADYEDEHVIRYTREDASNIEDIDESIGLQHHEESRVN